MDASKNHYWTYHDLPTLLACKQPVTASQDEDLFIAVHDAVQLELIGRIPVAPRRTVA